MTTALHVITVGFVGFITTSAVILGATLGLYVPLSKRLLACALAFAAGILVSALGIELAFRGAQGLHQVGFSVEGAWAFIAGGFAIGATLYYSLSRFLDGRGAAVRSPTRFREYALKRKKEETSALIKLLSKCEILRHLPPEAIEDLLSDVRERHLGVGEILFHAGDPGDALYIVASGKVVVLAPPSGAPNDAPIAELSAGTAFGEMALVSGEPRTATIRAVEESDLLEIAKEDFDRLILTDHELATAIQRLSHERAISNLTAGGADPSVWAKVATRNLDRVSRRESEKMLAETGHGAGLAIVLGDLLDTIPGLLVVGAKFTNLQSLSLAVMMGIFVGGIPESASSAALLRKAGFSARSIYGFWTISVTAGTISAIVGNLFIGNSASLVGVFVEAMAGGSLLALVAHTMMPEALHQGGSLVVLPTVAGFLAGLYVILTQALV